MLEFFRAGGWSMFVVVVLGGLALVAAAGFAVRPRDATVGTVRALSSATVFSVVGGVCANLAAVFSQVPAREEWAHSPDMPLIVMTGLGESLAPAILGFTLLSLAWLLAAVGVRRLDAAEA